MGVFERQEGGLGVFERQEGGLGVFERQERGGGGFERLGPANADAAPLPDTDSILTGLNILPSWRECGTDGHRQGTRRHYPTIPLREG